MSFNLSTSSDEISFYPWSASFKFLFNNTTNNITFSMITVYMKSVYELGNRIDNSIFVRVFICFIKKPDSSAMIP